MDQNFLYLIFHGDTRDLLRLVSHNGIIAYPLDRRATIKDIIEAVGVPHTEVGRIVYGSQDLTFQFIPAGGERIDIYPFTRHIGVTQTTVLRPDPLPWLKFLIDINVAKLARNLRMAGLDATLVADPAIAEIARLANSEQRIVLTRNRELLKIRTIRFGQLLRSMDSQAQLIEVVRRYGLDGNLRPFTRCLCCNELLLPVAKQDIDHRLQPLTRKYYNDFKQCPLCQNIFWRGSHHAKMVEMLTSK
jgi:uncharacterized protein with PIN domain